MSGRTPMSSSQTLKAIQSWATDRFCSQRIVYHHVPKCGGTSISRALRRAYIPSQAGLRPEESIKAFHAWQRGHQTDAGHPADLTEMMLLYLLYTDVRCIAAHAPFSNQGFEIFSDRYAFVTILRDPVERFISNFYWNTTRPPGERRIDQPLEEFLETDAAVRLGSTYARYFCGTPANAKFSTQDVDKAIVNLRQLNFVGFLDEMGEFSAALRRLTGRRIRIGTENVLNTNSRREAILSGPLRPKVLTVCAADREIWDAVQDLRSARAGNVSPAS